MKNRVYIVLFVFIVVFSIFMILVFGTQNIKSGQYQSTIIIGNHNTVWKYEKKHWILLQNRANFDSLSWEKYDVYSNNERLGEYYLWYNGNHWYAFNENKEAVNIEGDFLAFSGNYELDILPFVMTDVDDLTYVYQVLEEHNLSTSSQFSSLYKVVFDFDKDGVEEEFYFMSNVFPIGFTPDYLFSIVFMVKNDNIYMIYDDVQSYQPFAGCKPFFTSILDTDKDEKYEFILSCGYYSDSDVVDMLYHFMDNQFKILISSQ